MVLRAMKCSRQRRFFDQEIVDEQLTAEIDRDDRRRIGEIRRLDRIG